MKHYRYDELTIEGGNYPIVMSERQILNRCWDDWRAAMENKFGKGHEQITEQRCLEDWIKARWAWEVSVDGNRP